MKTAYIAAVAIWFAFAHSSPWGKDADLVDIGRSSREGICCTSPVRISPLAGWGVRAIRFHQEVISPADGPRSHFIPSSSQYTLEAMKKYGFFRGYLMGCDRLMRENNDEWVYRHTLDGAGKTMKWDPVP